MLTVAYDGTDYSGWQIQPDAETIEGILDRELSRILGENIRVIGASRTDAGVHALGQVASFSVKTDLGPAKVMERMNTYLPKDIIVTDCQLTDARFHARLNAKKKTYI